jgi:hypothetical protein
VSSRTFKRARRHAREIAREIDAQQRAARKMPRWRNVLLALGFSGFSRRWLTRWEDRHKKALAKSTKKTTHFIVEESRAMRAGPQPLPGARG